MTNQHKVDIQNIVNRKDNKEFVEMLIREYCKLSAENCQHLVNLIPYISSQQINFYLDQITDYRLAANWLIVEKSMNKKDKHSYFASMVPIVKTMYPNGLNINESEARCKYFKEFLELLSDSKVFSLSNDKDRDWAYQFGYLGYLKSMYDKYCK